MTAAFEKLIPADKGFDAARSAALRERGNPDFYSGDDLRYIGMPVSGICTGQIYLSGDGRLTHFDIFRDLGGIPNSGDPRGIYYERPFEPKQPVLQGAALRLGDAVRPIDKRGFSDVRFRGSYPIGHVAYDDSTSLVTVELDAYSPFIPLDDLESGLPATILTYTIRNSSDAQVTGGLIGFLENAIFPFDLSQLAGNRIIRERRQGDFIVVDMTADTNAAADRPGTGTMSLAIRSPVDRIVRSFSPCRPEGAWTGAAFDREASRPIGERLAASIEVPFTLAPGADCTIDMVVTWHFPHYSGGKVFFSTMENIQDLRQKKRFYASRFADSAAVADHVVAAFPQLSTLTRDWVRTWYDSTLPVWFLDRTFLNISTLATQTAHRFDDGRFYAWEGVDSCPGTCQHVWMYAQAVAHLFPALERSLREKTDYGIAYRDDGSLDYRAEASNHEAHAREERTVPGEAIVAVDGLAGTIMRVYREHRMSADDAFLKRLWPRVKTSISFLMRYDAKQIGLVEGAQYNTLDATWFGKIPSVTSIYLGAVAAGAAMAKEMGDTEFEALCRKIGDAGRAGFARTFFNGEYFVHRADPTRPKALDLGEASYIDQALGQGFAAQLGLPDVLPPAETASALRSLWRYNFTPDIGPYRTGFTEIEGGRWYAMPGEGGVIMCTWPLTPPNRDGKSQDELGLGVTSEGYLNECMTGFEYQVAAHMMAIDMVDEALAIVRTIHDRYHASRRNPWNEIECGDHYARAMASYGVYLTACGYDYHGPDGRMGFAPKIGATDFRAAFTAAEGWGSYSQRFDGEAISATLELRYGMLRLRRFNADFGCELIGADFFVTLDGKTVNAIITPTATGFDVHFNEAIELTAPSVLRFGGHIT